MLVKKETDRANAIDLVEYIENFLKNILDKKR